MRASVTWCPQMCQALIPSPLARRFSWRRPATTPAWTSSSPAQHLSGIDADFTVIGAEDAPVDHDAAQCPVVVPPNTQAPTSDVTTKSTVEQDNFFGILDDDTGSTPMATDPLVEKRK